MDTPLTPKNTTCSLMRRFPPSSSSKHAPHPFHGGASLNIGKLLPIFDKIWHCTTSCAWTDATCQYQEDPLPNSISLCGSSWMSNMSPWCNIWFVHKSLPNSTPNPPPEYINIPIKYPHSLPTQLPAPPPPPTTHLQHEVQEDRVQTWMNAQKGEVSTPLMLLNQNRSQDNPSDMHNNGSAWGSNLQSIIDPSASPHFSSPLDGKDFLASAAASMYSP